MNPPEPYITINGRTLTEAQAMTVRVALGSFAISLGDGEMAKAMGPIGPLYLDRLGEIFSLMSGDRNGR